MIIIPSNFHLYNILTFLFLEVDKEMELGGNTMWTFIHYIKDESVYYINYMMVVGLVVFACSTCISLSEGKLGSS